MAPKAGDALPDVTLFEGSPENKVSLKEVFANKKGILFAVPGAFTPGCTKTHLPSFINDYDKLKSAGAEVIVATAVNDPFVTSAWQEVTGANGKVRVLADPFGELAKALGVVLEVQNVFGTNRSKRYSAVVEGGKFKTFNLEADGTGTSCSLAPNILNQL